MSLWPDALTVLAAIGVLGIATAILNLFFALGGRPAKLSAPDVPPVDDEDRFLLALAGAVNAPTRGGGRAEVLNNGDEFFPAILDAIRGAECSINFFTYIFESGEIATLVMDALIERARAGVQVRLMLDAFGGKYAPVSRLDQLREAGGRIHYYLPLRFGKITRFHRRNHRRAIVIDGKIGFTGGASVADKWLGNADQRGHWRDCMFRVSGSLARSLQATFGEAWSNSCGEILVGPDFYPTGLDDERIGVRISRHVNLISSPSDEAHPLRKLFWLSFMATRERLYLTNAYFVPDEHIRRALIDRARDGVDVRILVPNEHTDAKPVWWASHSYYDELLREGIRIFEYQPTFLHSKTLVIDGKWSVIGSANLDVRSKELNAENVLGILDEDFGAELERTFLDDLRKAREIHLEEWRRRSVLRKLLERFFVLFAEQY